jgi:hypothetical protein
MRKTFVFISFWDCFVFGHNSRLRIGDIKDTFFLNNSVWMKELRPGASKIGFLVENCLYSCIPRSKLANPSQKYLELDLCVKQYKHIT